MIRCIPPFILNQYENDCFSGHINGYVLFFDIADFTAISGEFRNHGKQGAEEMIRFMEEVFGFPIGEIARNGGFVSVFAGDAFCSIFPEAQPENIIAAVNRIRKHFNENSYYTCSFGEFTVKVRLTICQGDINWRIFRNDYQCEYVFYGEVLREMAALSTHKESVIFSPHAAQKVGQDFFTRLEHGYDLKDTDDRATDISLEYQYQKESLGRFIHPKFAGETPENEIREAAYCFVDFTRIDEARQEETLALLHRLLDHYGGLLNKLDATDKGLVGLLLFGMPRSEGKTLERLCRFSLEVIAELPELSLGISCGRVFGGYIGSSEVHEYTALGSAVNLAARLMSKAQAGEVLNDSFISQDMQKRIEFRHLGAMSLKGFARPVNYYRMIKLTDARQLSHRSKVVGRDRELASLITTIDQAVEQGGNAVVYVHGEPGVGKSRLIEEALTRVEKEQCYHFLIPCNPTLQQPLDAVKRIVQACFYYNPSMPMEAGEAMFKGLWLALAGSDLEMLRIESIIASLLGYHWAGSTWSALPDKEKPAQLRHSFVTLIKKLASQKPVILHVDDGQWLDTTSLEFFQAIEEGQSHPVLVFSACRYLDSGEQVDFELPTEARTHITLTPLQEEGNRELIRSILRIEQVPAATLKLIQQRSMGNPLFTEQLCAYMLENGNIDAAGKLQGDLDDISTFGISDVIGSRIDQLSHKVRECVFSASVLGLEFNTRVLSQMLEKKIGDDLTDGKSNRIWNDLDELHYIFTHVMIKDTAYQRMMSEKLKELHLLAAESMELVQEESLEEHAEVIGTHFERAGKLLPAAEYYDKAGLFYLKNIEYGRAEPLLQQALALREKILDTEHPDLAQSLNNLATIYRVQGRYAASEPLHRRALAIREKALGAEHPATAQSLNNLATVYKDQGEYEQAKSLQKRALAIREKTLGAEHLDTAFALSNLASTLKAQGEYEEAEPLYRRSLSILEKSLGSEHPETAHTLNNLASLNHTQGRYEEAEPLYRRSLTILEKVLGAEHPRTALALNNLATLFETQGKYEAAEPLFQRALAIREQVLGAEHPTTASGLANLANIYQDQDKYAMAEQLFQQALQIMEKTVGVEHPETANTLNNLAFLYKTQGRYEEAEPLYLRALAIREKSLGAEHPETATSLNNLAALYWQQQKLAVVAPLLERALAIREKVLGVEHSDTAVSFNNVAILYCTQGKHEEAEVLYLRALALEEKVMGVGHRKTATVLHNLAGLHMDQGDYKKAEPYIQRALAALENALGTEHPDTQSTIVRAVELYEQAGDEEKANEYRAKLTSSSSQKE
jgi:tetratricopeptide (TPR) repeat protein/class 3 adenylate cyclase